MSMLNQQFGMALPRRSLLQAGACSLLGLGLPQLLSHQAVASAGGSFGSAKRCIFIFLWGGPSHIDTLDPKPEAPTDIRGSFSPINTSVPGVQVSELLPNIAQRMHDVAVIRSLNHTDPAHLSSAHAALTGQLAPVPRSDAEPPSERDAPHIGSVVARLRSAPRGLPGFVTMPWIAYHPAAPGGQAPGQRAGWLGHNYDPMLVEGDPSQNQWRVPALQLQDALSAERLSSRMQLLTDLDAQRAALNASASGLALNGFQQQATELLTSPRVREAFSIDQETEETRNRYGRNIHGQCVLLARRLSERGVPLVCVNWHNDGQNFWDTHGNNFGHLKQHLPTFDAGISALIDDLHERGLQDDVTVVVWGEFGRTPKINDKGGRDHWAPVQSVLVSGGGMKEGIVIGSTDKTAAYAEDRPVHYRDVLATIYYNLGIESYQYIRDQNDRPVVILPEEARPIRELL
ncbi:MAG: DUF1501 domain-containing protein [Planctomycetaceae bacterium]|nr:DUF1501 domain-containing protein [Planctomycetaceae bacterium]